MADLYLDIVSPSKSVFQGIIKSVTVPGTKGRFQILINHAPIVSTFEIGMIRVDLNNKSDYYATGGGTVEVLDNQITLLADSIELTEDIDVDRAMNAKKRAEERLASKSADINVLRAQAALQRALNRLSIKDKYLKN